MRTSPDPQLRAARKELLLLRAELERVELGQAIGEVRETVSHLGWLRFLAPVVMGLRKAAKGKGQGKKSRWPSWPGSIAALLFARPLGAKAVPVFRLASLAFTAWQAWRMWQRFRQNNTDTQPSDGGEKKS
jgi:hypothetical protein